MDRKPFEIKVHVLLWPSCGISLFPRCNASPFHRAVSRRWIKLKHSTNFLKLWDGDKWASPELQCLEIQLSERRHRKNAKPDVLSELQEVPLHLHITQRLGSNAAVITAERKGSNLSFRNVVEVFGTENICMRHESLFNEWLSLRNYTANLCLHRIEPFRVLPRSAKMWSTAPAGHPELYESPSGSGLRGWEPHQLHPGVLWGLQVLQPCRCFSLDALCKKSEWQKPSIFAEFGCFSCLNGITKHPYIQSYHVL